MNRELNAILTVIAKGYDVTIKINGMDIGIRGQKSESVKLFGKFNPTPPVLPEDMKNQVCLQEDENSISVYFKHTEAIASPGFSIELQARDQFVNGGTLFSRKEEIEVGKEKSFSDIFTI